MKIINSFFLPVLRKLYFKMSIWLLIDISARDTKNAKVLNHMQKMGKWCSRGGPSQTDTRTSFTRKPKVKGLTKRVSRYECPLIRAVCWTLFRARVYRVLVNIWWTHAGGIRVLPLESEMLLGEFVLAIVDIIWWSSIGHLPLSFRTAPIHRKDCNLSPLPTRVFLPPVCLNDSWRFSLREWTNR